MELRLTLKYIAAIILCMFNSFAFAKQQDLASIEHEVVEFIKQQHSADAILNVQLQRLDSRLRLENCDQALEVNWSPGSRMVGRTTLSVSCESPKPWRIFVRSTVEKESLTWVLNAPVRKGDTLTRQMVTQQSVMLGRGGQYGVTKGTPIIEIESWLGHVFVQAMQAGRIVGDQALKLPYVVEKGDSVSISYNSAKLAVKTKGIALESGALQDRISVKNTVSNKIIEALVVGQANVSISR